jgi:hypothetical protein
MKTYRVRWEIDIDASTALEAVEKARLIQLEEDSIYTMFKIYATKIRRDLIEKGEYISTVNFPNLTKEELKKIKKLREIS